MSDRDDTDEMPVYTGDDARTEPLAPPPPQRRDDRADEATVVVPPTRDGAAPDAPVQDRDRERDAPRPSKFAGARRRALLWDAGYCMVSGLVLLVLWAADRPVESLPDWSSLVTGLAVVVWAAVLVAIASGGVGRTATALVGLINLLVGAVGVGLGWFYPEVNTLAVVVAAQVTAIGVVQLLASVRR